MIRDEDIDQAWQDIARLPLWRMARLKLVRLLMEGPPANAPESALREWSGRAQMARHLLAMTEPEGQEHDRSDDDRIILARPGPVERGTRGARRRIAGAAG